MVKQGTGSYKLMNPENEISVLEEASDESLVVSCLGGDREAFGLIVTRYQRMLCSIAYSALGNLRSSEEVAQEAFVEAWKKLETLREPDKLRSWLCGILRFKISHRRRKESRQPEHGAEELDELAILESEEPRVEDVAMREEEQALLWKALEKVPENYREPLVLYYREHQSIEHVAYELDLSEDAVKQRLSRGRKMLQERMMTFVEESLVRSGPSRVFTMGVLAALPALAPPAKAAGVGVATLKASGWLKWSGLITFVAIFSGFISSFFALRANLEQARTIPEKRNVIRTTIKLFGSSVGFSIVLFALFRAAIHWYPQREYIMIAAAALILVFLVLFPLYTHRFLRDQRRLRTAERKRSPESFSHPRDAIGSKQGEYKSRATLFGVPLVHIRFSIADEGVPPAFGWIAAGDYAYGLLFAWGGFVVAPVSVGIISVGFVSCGAIGLGLLGIGMIGIGPVAFGAVAIGVNALGSLFAVGWETALSGGFALSREAALGAVAYAEHANNELAQAVVNQSDPVRGHLVLLTLISFLVIVPVVLYAKAVRKRMAN